VTIADLRNPSSVVSSETNAVLTGCGMSQEERPFNLDYPDWFWAVIDGVRNRPAAAEEIFRALSDTQVEEFYCYYREASNELYPEYSNEEMDWDDNDISRASDWVVNQGKAYYLSVWKDLGLFPDPFEISYCALSGWAASLYYERHGKEIRG
jgi:hypothetical protein